MTEHPTESLVALEPTVRERIEALPEQAATTSRDYGRGYARAVRDVLELLWAHDRHWLAEECACDPEVVAGQIARTPLPARAKDR